MKYLKKIIYGIFCTCLITSVFSVSKATFDDEIKNMGIDTNTLADQKGVSRYDITRLLNASECKDCIHPQQKTIENYTGGFRNLFSATPGEYFGDIGYPKAIDKNTNYYYCVAYVGDNKYMNGYPKATSPICAGKFCGNAITTKAEFIQIIINLLNKYLYDGIQMPWKQANQWINQLKTDSYEAKTFTTDDKTMIVQQSKICTTDSCYLTSPDQMPIYLKFCMFNLASCNMQVFDGLKQGYWPIAEVNLLYKQNIISLDQDLRKNTSSIVDGKTVVDIISKVYSKIQCTFNDDYDCDGITNSQDNCPNDYNPHQTDTNHDGIGDVCSDDMDGDGIKNPKGIVDDNGRVNIRVLIGWTGTLDNCLFTPNADQKDSNLNSIGDACDESTAPAGIFITIPSLKGSAPVSVPFEAHTTGNVSEISRDFGDGQQDKGNKVQHIFSLPGIYRIQATTKTFNQSIKAQVIIIIGGVRDIQTAMQGKVDSVGKTETGDFALSPSLIGDVDSILRSVSSSASTQQPTEEPTQKQPQDILHKLRGPGEYTITLKAMKNKAIQAVSMFTIGVGNNKGSMLKSTFLNPETNQPTDFQTTLFGFSTADIAYVQWDFGDGTQESNQEITASHTYTKGGKRAVIQTIHFIDGTSLTNIITLYIIDKTLLSSYGLILTPDKLTSNRGEALKFTSTIVGDKNDSMHTLIVKYDNQSSQSIASPTFPVYTYHTYINTDFALPTSSVFINQCSYLQAQATIKIQGIDSCLQAKEEGTLHKRFKCDMDKDGIPDMCDNDIDGDGVPNPIGIITHEEAGCAINQDNIDPTLAQESIGTCSLDNAPFDPNSNQEDLNGDGIGDQNTIAFTGLQVSKDSDGDGIPDDQDLCPTINGMGSANGCPTIDETCINNGDNSTNATDGNVTAIECQQCPCQYTDFIQSLSNGDQVQAILRDKQRTILYNYSSPWIVNF